MGEGKYRICALLRALHCIAWLCEGSATGKRVRPRSILRQPGPTAHGIARHAQGCLQEADAPCEGWVRKAMQKGCSQGARPA
ncbi:hypothetical protein QE399_001454 [Paracidovorax wautersii]|uniref:Secreted protein n=1 Tax=Paracidovorax wautersii TaxID=1177982 RepID=A0ABU1I970_9BURK|nr:hypothetical protein [Paracidovorax wautersii]